MGVTWIPLVVGAYLALHYRAEGESFARAPGRARRLRVRCARSAWPSSWSWPRDWRLGSHYDVSPLTLVSNPLTGQVYSFVAGSAEQVLNLAVLPQLLVWPVYTVLAGLVGAGLVRLVAAAWGRPQSPAVSRRPRRIRFRRTELRLTSPGTAWTPCRSRTACSPLSNLEHTRAALQSASTVQVSHSPPSLQPARGSAASDQSGQPEEPVEGPASKVHPFRAPCPSVQSSLT